MMDFLESIFLKGLPEQLHQTRFRQAQPASKRSFKAEQICRTKLAEASKSASKKYEQL